MKEFVNIYIKALTFKHYYMDISAYISHLTEGGDGLPHPPMPIGGVRGWVAIHTLDNWAERAME